MGTTRPKRPTAAERRVNELERLIAKRDADLTHAMEIKAALRADAADLAADVERLKAELAVAAAQLENATMDRARAVQRYEREEQAHERTKDALDKMCRLDAEGLAFARCVEIFEPLQTTRYAGGIGPTTGVVDNAQIERVLRMLALRFSIDLSKAGA